MHAQFSGKEFKPHSLNTDFASGQAVEDVAPRGEFLSAESANAQIHLINNVGEHDFKGIEQAMLSTALIENGDELTTEVEFLRREFGYEESNVSERTLIDQVVFWALKIELLQARLNNSAEMTSSLIDLKLKLRQAQAQFNKTYDALTRSKNLVPEFTGLM